MSLELTVVVCTHNPRPAYLARVLGSLRAQSLPRADWELLIIDNASSPPLAADVAWHPRGRLIREMQLGLTPARLRGIAEVGSPLVVFVDDDNVLRADYLEQAVEVGRSYPHLGAWGGQVLAEFERAPEEWTRPFWPYLAIREVKADLWSNLPWTSPTTPWGAGLCVRREVARRYAEHCGADAARAAFDRKGGQLTSSGDVDLALTACELGLGAGVFRRLELTHLIPPERLDEGYLLRLVESSNYSNALLLSIRGVVPPGGGRPSRLGRYGRRLLDLVRLSRRDRRFKRAVERGCERAALERASSAG